MVDFLQSLASSMNVTNSFRDTLDQFHKYFLTF